jgi:hypothetical protein
MIKKNAILATLFLSSCAFIDYTALPSITKSIVFGAEDIKVDQDFFQDQKYSFVKVKIGRHSIAIFVLSKVENNKFYWIASNGARLTTLRDGRPIQLTADTFNFKIIPTSEFVDISSTQMPYEYFISLANPKAYLSQASILTNAGRTEINSLGKNIQVTIIKEEVSSMSMNWDYANEFYVDNSGLGLRSELYFNPLAEKLELNFFYKF